MKLNPRQWTTKQRVGALLALVVIVAAVITLLLMLANGSNKTAPTDKALTNAEKATSNGDYDQAFETLKDAEASAITNEEKVRLYNDLAAAAANAGKLQNALEYYAKKHQLDPGSRKADSYLLGELYERTGNVKKAIESYELYIEYAESLPQQEFGDAQVASLKERITELEGQQP